MPNSKNERRLTGYRGDTNVGQIQHHSLYDDDMDNYHAVGDDDTYEEYDEDLEDARDDDRDDTGSELSIPDPNIDFDLVYALHTFTATVEGQASVVRGDALTLLDDSNSYWWLVKVLKSAEVGYIPAENIETPHERLARLNSHRNIELTKRDIQDNFPKPPSNKSKKRKRVTLAKGVQFQSQIVYGTSDDESDYEAEFEHWNERMRSDDSEDDTDDDDPYQYYQDQNSYYADQQTVDMYASSYTAQNQVAFDMHNGPTANNYNNNNNNPVMLPEDEPIDYYNDDHLSGDSDIINDPEDQVVRKENRDTMNLENETIKISLTPSIARGYGENRHSDGNIQSKLKKAAKLEKLLGGSSPSPEPESQRNKSSKDKENKKERSGIRKFFSRGNNNSKESKKSKQSSSNKNSQNEALERHPSNGSSNYETGSISSSMQSYERERSGSQDSTSVQATKIKVYPGNVTDFGDIPYKYAMAYPSTTSIELIQQLVQLEQDEDRLLDDNAYQDYHIMIKTSSGDEFTLVPSDKPLEIFHSLTAHLSTPMPSLKKARRISQLMGSENTHIGGPKDSQQQLTSEDQVQFYLFSKTRCVEEGEIQIKVSLFSPESNDVSKRVDKLVKIPASMLVRDATSLLLEKFHILNGIVAGSNTNDAKSLRLDGNNDVVSYGLVVNYQGDEHLLNLDDTLIQVFGDDVPTIHYRRNSNPDRSSITVNIATPDKNETYFILKRMEKPQPVVAEHAHAENNTHRPPKLVRQDTPMPQKEDTPTEGFETPVDQMPITINTSREVTSSPEETVYSKLPLSMTPTSTEDILSQLDEAIDNINHTHHIPSQKKQQETQQQPVAPPRQTAPPRQAATPQQKPQVQVPPPQKRVRPESVDSMLFANDFGMNDLMVIIRGAAQSEKIKSKITHGRHTSYNIRSEISEVFKDSQTRLDQLEKELDRIMAESLRVYH